MKIGYVFFIINLHVILSFLNWIKEKWSTDKMYLHNHSWVLLLMLLLKSQLAVDFFFKDSINLPDTKISVHTDCYESLPKIGCVRNVNSFGSTGRIFDTARTQSMWAYVIKYIIIRPKMKFESLYQLNDKWYDCKDKK